MPDWTEESRIQPITELLPEGWEEKAKELKAFTRRGDYIQTPAELLRILMLWADFGSYGFTASFLRTTRDYPLSKVAIYERVKKSGAWLKWLVLNFCYEYNYLVPKPSYLESYRILATDATKVSKPGSTTADYVLHEMIDLFSLSRVEQHLTTAEVGETMTNFTDLQPNDLVIGDRAYGTLTSMMWMEAHQAYFLFRLKANSFSLYQKNANGQFVRFDLTEKLTDWEEGKLLEFDLFYRKGKEYFPVRVCALGKTADAIEKGSERIKRSNHGENRTKVTPLQTIYNKFIVVVTNLPKNISAAQVMDLYRLRWQIELVFKRMKSIMNYDEVQTKLDSTSDTWFWCKLLTAAICELYVQRSAFFPYGNSVGWKQPEIIMAGIRSCLRRPDFAYS